MIRALIVAWRTFWGVLAYRHVRKINVDVTVSYLGAREKRLDHEWRHLQNSIAAQEYRHD